MTNFQSRLQPSRRAILAGLGAGTAATFLQPLLGKAQNTPAPQRLLIIHRPMGTVQNQWWPSGSGDTWTASPILSEFEALRDQMVVIKGMNCPLGNWIASLPALGMLAMMTPSPSTGGKWPETRDAVGDPNSRFITALDASIDQQLLQNVPSLQTAPLGSLQLGVSAQSANSVYPSVGSLSYAKPAGQSLASPLVPSITPSAVLQSLRGVAAEPPASAELDQQLIEFLTTDVQRLRARAPSTEAGKLDAHLAALRGLEADLAGPACSLPELDALPEATPDVTLDEAQYDAVQRQQLQLVKAAFQCDLTRVVTFSFGSSELHLRFDKILPPGAINTGDGLYGLSQNSSDNSVQARTVIEKYFASKVAGLLLDLKNTPEPRAEGSLLDNTLVVYLSECSGIPYHSPIDMPVLAFGGKSLGLKGGSYLQFFGERCMPDFWVSVAQAFGYTDLKAFGAAEWNKGPLPGLFG